MSHFGLISVKFQILLLHLDPIQVLCLMRKLPGANRGYSYTKIHIIESDATIVAPPIFAWIPGW